MKQRLTIGNALRRFFGRARAASESALEFRTNAGAGRDDRSDRLVAIEPLESRTLFSASPAAAVELDAAQTDPQAAVLSDFYVFGDSLSDIGELFERTGGTDPVAPYFNGRFSSGPIWVEQLAPSLGLTSTDAKNWAVAGATTGFGNVNDTPTLEHPGMLDGILEYVAGVASVGADPDALYVVWAGPNDFLSLTSFDPATIGAAINDAVTNIATGVGALASVGARHILVPNLPDLGLTPRGIFSGIGPSLTELSAVFNFYLDGALDQLAGFGIDTIRMDVFARQNEVAADPAANGFTDVTTPYIITGTGQDVADYLFFDDIHPTEEGHGFISDLARDTIYAAGLLPSLSFSAGQSVHYTDADGDRVTVKLTGPGSGEVRLLGDRSDAAQILLEGTTKASKLVISVAGGLNGQTTVYDLDVNGSLGRLVAPNVDVINDVRVTGTIRSMRVDEFVGASPQSITIRGESSLLSDAFRLMATNPEALTVDAGVPVITIDVDGPFKTTPHSQDGPSFLRNLACTHRFKFESGFAIAG